MSPKRRNQAIISAVAVAYLGLVAAQQYRIHQLEQLYAEALRLAVAEPTRTRPLLPVEWFSSATIEPAIDREKMRGIQISGIQAGSPWAELGIQDGDIITEVEGRPVDSAAASVELLQALAANSETPLAVDRSGTTVRLP